MYKKVFFIAISILCLFSFLNICHANEINVGVNVECDDDTVQFTVIKATLDTLKKSVNHKVDQTKPHALKIMFAVSTIKDANGSVWGAAVAILAVTKKPDNQSKIIYFGNEFIELAFLIDTVQTRVNQILK